MKNTLCLKLCPAAAVLIFLLSTPLSASEKFQGPSLQKYGCTTSGRSVAMAIDYKSFRLAGPDALGQRGDYLIMNDRAAFVIEGLDRINTYYYYGGILIDAVALESCVQEHPEQFEEIGFFIGELKPFDLKETGVRAFRGERIEIINDGSDGSDAVIRVYGVDDYFWIVEFETMLMAYDDLGIPKKLTQPLGLELYVDYILPPDSQVLRIEFNVMNPSHEKRSVFTGAGGFFGDATENRYFSEHPLKLGPFDIDAGLPCLVSSGGQGAWAFGMEGADMGTTNLSGFDAFFNTRLLRKRIILSPAGKKGDSARVVHYFSVGDSDYNSALAQINRANPSPLKGWDIELVDFSGRVVDSVSGEGIAGVDVEIEMQDRRRKWKFIDGFQTGADGSFSGRIPELGKEYRVTASLEGRPSPQPIIFDPASTPEVNIEMDPGGVLEYDVRDGDGTPLPARIVLYQGGPRPARTIYCARGSGEAEVAPGRYEVSVLRGYEYIPVETEVVIEPNGTARLDAVLFHAVDTRGFMSADMHIHAGPSGDNKITIPERIVTAAAEGLEVAVSTDHEAIISWQPGIEATGLGDWVATVLGEEVTATVPEHMNMFPVESRFDVDARGGPVRWYGMGIGEVYQAMYDRGAAIAQLNHPRGYMDMIRYDRGSGTARLKHPEYMGLSPGDSLWSWNFDSIEYQNGNKRVFDSAGRRGTFEDWMSFINLGHQVTAVGNTDVHDFGLPGSPRNYFPSRTDSPSEFDVADLVEAVRDGRILVSTGAFARVEVNGEAGMGDTAIADGDEVEVWVYIESIPQIDVSHFKVFVNCDQALEVDIEPTDEVVKYDGTVRVKIEGDSQIVVMGFGKDLLPRGLPQFDPLGVPRFTTNPVFVDQGGDGYTAPGWDGCYYRLP